MTRIKGRLYFSQKYLFENLNWDDKNKLIEAFEDRVNGFYLEPAKKLNSCKKYAFATGVMCVTTIDSLARVETGLLEDVRVRFEKWLKSNIKEFKEPAEDNIAYRFYDNFRNGLVHEGRIKYGSQFSYEKSKLIEIEDSVMIVNPEYLLMAIDSSFKRYIEKVRKEEFEYKKFRATLIKDFEVESRLSR